MQSPICLKNNIGKKEKRKIGIFINDKYIMSCGESPIRIFSTNWQGEVMRGEGKS